MSSWINDPTLHLLTATPPVPTSKSTAVSDITMGLFGKTPEIPPYPQIPPPPPQVPPLASSSDNLVKNKTKLKRKTGDYANLMTGGLGLSNLSPSQLSVFTLGGSSKMGAKS
jgi:hypothetical protein